MILIRLCDEFNCAVLHEFTCDRSPTPELDLKFEGKKYYFDKKYEQLRKNPEPSIAYAYIDTVYVYFRAGGRK